MRPDPLEICILGPLEVTRGDLLVDLPPSKKARALLGYLVATERAHGRSSLCDLFWDGVDDPRAGLRWALSKLRSVVDEGENRRIVTAGDRVGFRADGAEVDLHRVRSLAGDHLSSASVEDLSEAATTFRGAFLEDIDLPGCHGYHVWCLGMRERLRTLRVSIHSTLAERLRNDAAGALPHALARLRLDPFSEDAYVAAIELLGDVGRIDQALEVYERCRRMLSRQLGIPPSAALIAARRRLTAGTRVARPGGMDGVAGTSAAAALAGLSSAEHVTEPGDDDVPLVGRDAELAALRGIIHRRGTVAPAAVVFVTGEPGIGKTRLLREMVREVRSARGWVVSGRVFETEEIRPYGPWAEMLRQVPAAALDAGSRSGLTALLGEWPPEHRGKALTDRTQLFDAVAGLLARMGKACAPGLVILDDVQWLDASSAAVLHYVTRTLDEPTVIFALAAREEEIDPGSTIGQLLRSLDERGHLLRMPLGRLSASDTSALVRAVSRALDPEPVFATSEGNPYFALAIAASRREGVLAVPATVDEELSARLERLDSAGLALLPWAAALGRVFDIPTLVHVVDRPAAEIVDAIGRLERRGILRATGEDRYDFTHSLLRTAAYRRPSEPARRVIHRSIARKLDALDRSEGRAPGAVAHHAALGGLAAVSVRACIEGAEESLWIFAYDEATELVERGLSQLERLPEETRIPLEMGLLRIYSFRSMRDRRPDDVEDRVRRLTGRALEAGLREVIAHGHALLMELQYQRGAFHEAGESSVRSAQVGRAGSPVTATRALAETAACLLILDQAPADARRLAGEASALADEHRIDLDVVALARALLHHHDGRLNAAASAFQEVIRLGRQAKDHWWACPALTRMIMVDLDRGDPALALRRAREAEELAGRMADEEEAAFARGLGAVAAAMTDAGPGLQGVDAALAGLRELDSLWKIGHIQAYAAEVELRRDRTEKARERATEVLEAARSLDRPSLTAVAHGLLAHCNAVEGRRDEADGRLESMAVDHPPERFSHRARALIRRARGAGGG